MAGEKKPLRLEDIPLMNLGKYILNKMREFQDMDAVVDASSGTTYTYRQLSSRVERLAAGFQQFGIREGDVICILSPNHIDYLTVYYASVLINAVLQCINPSFTTDDLHKVLKDCDTKFVVTIPPLVEKVEQAEKGLCKIKNIVFGECGGCTSLDSILAPPGTPYIVLELDWKQTTSVLLYSSGTTGFPKAVKHSHYSLIANSVQINHAGINYPGQVMVSFLPMFHIYGLVGLGSVTHCMGVKLVVMTRFDIDEYLGLLEKYKPKYVPLVPPVMVLLAKYPKVSEYDLSSLKTIICGAAPLSAEIEDAVKKRLKVGDIQQGYGMTEVNVTHVNTEEKSRHNAVGKLLGLTEHKIVDVETGKSLGIGEEGELWVRGPQVSNGYLNLPAQTREMFLADGWVRTGDIGKVDADGYLYIVDRLKELIKYKGEQVAPATLEDILLRHEAVADVGVIGVPDEAAGELPKAYVVKKADKHVTEKELQDFVAGKVAPHMKLRGGVEFIDDILRSLSGKILRKTLRERAKVVRSKL